MKTSFNTMLAAIITVAMLCVTAMEIVENRDNAEHYRRVSHDLFAEWIYDACGTHDNANIHWDDMYFNCKVPLTQEQREEQLSNRK